MHRVSRGCQSCLLLQARRAHSQRPSGWCSGNGHDCFPDLPRERFAASGLSAMQSTVSNLQSTDVSVQVQVGGVPAKASEVSVSFSASCGTFSPVTSLSLAGGTARSTYTPNPSCAGPVTLNANAPGASTATATVNVAASVPANILFGLSVGCCSVSRPSSAPNGVKSSTVRFQAVNELNAGIGGQNLLLALDAQSLAAGVTSLSMAIPAPRRRRWFQMAPALCRWSLARALYPRLWW